MPDAAVPVKQSREYKGKVIAQIIGSLITLFGFNMDPEMQTASTGVFIAGAELAYLLIRRRKAKKAVTA